MSGISRDHHECLNFRFIDVKLNIPESMGAAPGFKSKGQSGTQGKELRASPRDAPATLSQ